MRIWCNILDSIFAAGCAVAAACLVSCVGNSERQRAERTLELCGESERDGVEMPADSLIREAADFYAGRRGNARNRFLSLCYWGRALCNEGSYFQAIVVFSEAEELLDKVKDDALAGMLYVQIGDLYRANYDFSKSLEAYTLARNHYERSGDRYWSTYCLLDMGLEHWNAMDFKTGEELILQARSQASEAGYDYLRRLCLENLIIIYDAHGETAKAEAVIDSLRTAFGSDTLLPICANAIANTFTLRQESDSAALWTRKAWESAKTETDSLTLLYQPVRVLQSMGRSDEALRMLQQSMTIQNRHLRRSLNLLSASKEFFHSQATLNAWKLRKNNQIYLILSLVAALVIVIVCLISRWKILDRDRRLSQYIDLAESLRKSLSDNESRMAEMATGEKALNSKVSEMSGQIAGLFAGQYALLDRLIGTYYETSAYRGGKERDAIYRQVKSEIDRFSQDADVLAKLEKIVNTYKNNVLAVIRAEIPSVSARDMKLLTYLYAGFSPKSVSVFTGDTMNNVMTRKYRFRLKVKRLNPSHAQVMLDEMP